MRATRGMVGRVSAVQNLDCPLRSTRAALPVRTKGSTGLGYTRGRLGVIGESELSVLRERAEGGDEDRLISSSSSLPSRATWRNCGALPTRATALLARCSRSWKSDDRFRFPRG
jgi:hypothetical protein